MMTFYEVLEKNFETNTDYFNIDDFIGHVYGIGAKSGSKSKKFAA